MARFFSASLVACLQGIEIKKENILVSMVVYDCNLSTRETEAKGSQVQGQPEPEAQDVVQ
jgi:hypothetical protein